MIPRAIAGRIGARLTGFAPLHALTAGLNLVYTFVQMLVLARVLEPWRYAEIIALVSISFYLQPLDQSLGRASYVVLRQQKVGGSSAGRRDDISAFLLGHVVLLAAVCLLAPLALGRAGPALYLENMLFLMQALFMNAWAFNLQSTAWAVDLQRSFSIISILRRAVHFIALGALWLTGSLLVFGLIAFSAVAIGHVVAMVMISRHSGIPLWPSLGTLSWQAIGAHLRHIGTSFLNALSELVILNSPYGLLTFLFGVGPAVVVYDSVMKLTRLTMAGSRTIAEIFLARFTRALIEGNRRDAMRAATVAGTVCVVLSLVPAVIVAFAGPLVFSLLLGQNNVVPPEASLAAAAIIAISGIYQPTALFLSYGNYEQGIRRFTLLCCVALAVLVAVVATLMPPIAQIIWIYAVFFGLCTCFSAWLSFEMIRRVGPEALTGLRMSTRRTG